MNGPPPFHKRDPFKTTTNNQRSPGHHYYNHSRPGCQCRGVFAPQERGIMMKLNCMCKDCLCLGKSCLGTDETVWTGCVRKVSERDVRRIVDRNGGYREWKIMKGPHTLEPTETWNYEHKVVNVLALEIGPDGYQDGFAVDLVGMSICG